MGTCPAIVSAAVVLIVHPAVVPTVTSPPGPYALGISSPTPLAAISTDLPAETIRAAIWGGKFASSLEEALGRVLDRLLVLKRSQGSALLGIELTVATAVGVIGAETDLRGLDTHWDVGGSDVHDSKATADGLVTLVEAVGGSEERGDGCESQGEE